MEVVLLGMGLGAIVGLVLALTGAGGGILAVPLLVFGMQLPVSQAAPVSLIAVGLTSALSAALGLRQGIMRYRAAALIGVAGMLLAPVGMHCAAVVPDGPLTIAFGLLLAFVALRMIRGSAKRAGASAGTRAKPPPCDLDPGSGRLAWTLPCGRALAATGAVSGLLSGLLGVGGGFVIVPSLSHFTRLDTRSVPPPRWPSSRSSPRVAWAPPRWRARSRGTSPRLSRRVRRPHCCSGGGSRPGSMRSGFSRLSRSRR